MPRYEYTVVPAPTKAAKVKGVKGTEARFAHELEQLMNRYGAEGWEYQRSDTLPCEERSGLTGRTTRFQNLLVFRRALDAEEPRAASFEPAVQAPEHSAEPAEPVAAPEPVAEPQPVTAPAAHHVPAPEAPPVQRAEPDLPSFRSTAHDPAHPAKPQFTSRIQEGRSPRLGGAHTGSDGDRPPEAAKR